jgi:hypothetical protein
VRGLVRNCLRAVCTQLPASGIGRPRRHRAHAHHVKRVAGSPPACDAPTTLPNLGAAPDGRRKAVSRWPLPRPLSGSLKSPHDQMIWRFGDELPVMPTGRRYASHEGRSLPGLRPRRRARRGRSCLTSRALRRDQPQAHRLRAAPRVHVAHERLGGGRAPLLRRRLHRAVLRRSHGEVGRHHRPRRQAHPAAPGDDPLPRRPRVRPPRRVRAAAPPRARPRRCDRPHEYAQLRGCDPATPYGGGTWHKSPGELLANDFRILVAGVEPEFWPHPGSPTPMRRKQSSAGGPMPSRRPVTGPRIRDDDAPEVRRSRQRRCRARIPSRARGRRALRPQRAPAERHHRDRAQQAGRAQLAVRYAPGVARASRSAGWPVSPPSPASPPA